MYSVYSDLADPGLKNGWRTGGVIPELEVRWSGIMCDPSQVLYFGDHVYSDLADPGLKNGWRTGGVIPELEVR